MDTRKSQQGKPMKKISTKTKQMEDQEGVALDSGQARLEALGYKQELSRRLGLCSSVASSFATMAYMMGITGMARAGLAWKLTMSYSPAGL